MNAWQDGFSVLASDWRLVAVILVCIFVGQCLIVLPLKKIFSNNLTFLEYLSLGSAGWIAPVLLVALVGHFTGSTRIVFIFSTGLAIFLFLRLKSDRKPASPSTLLIAALFLFISIILRLAYVSKAIFPSYFDSAQHYWIIKNILGNDRLWIFNWPTGSYYHLGYHFLTAFIVSITNVEITRTMLIMGQVVLAFIPFAVYFLVRQVTTSNIAGWFAVILAAIGWYMPAHALDWGKYPALFSLGLILFVTDIVYLLIENKKTISIQARYALYGFLGLGVLASVFLHSRSVIILGIILVAWFITVGWRKLPQTLMHSVFILLFITIVLQIVLIQQHEVLKPLIDPYFSEGIFIMVLVLILSVFGYKVFPQMVFACTLTMCLMFASLYVPLNGLIPGFDNLTLLDRPYIEMSLFLPLSLLGGVGLAGLEKTMMGGHFGSLVIGIVIAYAFFTYNVYPSDCCVIVGNDDVVAMDWIANQLSADARIGISSTELIVIASNVSTGIMGADAGIWVMPLTGRITLPLPYQFEFDQLLEMERLCELGIDYLFVGESGQPFDVKKIISRPGWYRPLLSMPKTRVYEVIGCNDN